MRRRSILRTAGSITAFGAVGVTNATEKDEQIGASEVGLEDEIAKLLRNGRVTAAKTLLDQHDIRHNITREGGSDGSVGIQHRYSKSESEIQASLVRLEDDLYLASGTMLLNGIEYYARQAFNADDACALVYDHSEWTSPDPTKENVWLNDNTGGHDLQFDHYNPNYGVAAKMDLAKRYIDTVASVQTKLIKKNNDERVPVKFAYEHTWAYLDSFTGDVTISLAGGVFNATLPFEVSTAWKKEKTTYIK